jgi:hypothetical protein
METKIEDSHLVIRIPLQTPTPSSSGKTLIVASTGGNVVTTAMVDGKPVVVGLNAYIKPGKAAADAPIVAELAG